ncbi:MAG TPA: integrase [Candidatus Methylomirabilis sp.]|nr:integrase [Candidatus Methylomirabilis sp.]
MRNAEALSLERIRQFLAANEQIEYCGASRGEMYAWVEKVLFKHRYRRQSKEVRGLLRAYIEKVTGLSSAQVTRLIRQYTLKGHVCQAEYRRHRFPRRYTKLDIELLASVDEAHERMSGPATKRICEREWRVFGKREFQALAAISVSHLYNLRRTATYLRRALPMGKTRSAKVTLGERRKPDPGGRPGYLRVDTVHQPERDGEKSVYHINAVDEVTQWEVVGCAARITEHYLVPVLKSILEQFPFPILGFHCDNGSEYVNQTVVDLLNKLLAEFTKSRPRHSNDNALVEGKNGAVVRKHMSYAWLPPSHAQDIHAFYAEWLNPYLNYHRPCAFATVKVDGKGRETKVYETYVTPYERLRSLPKSQRKLKPGVTWEQLDQLAKAHSDTEFARQMQKAKRDLFRLCARGGASAPAPPDVGIPAMGAGGRP